MQIRELILTRRNKEIRKYSNERDYFHTHLCLLYINFLLFSYFSEITDHLSTTKNRKLRSYRYTSIVCNYLIEAGLLNLIIDEEG